MEFLGYDFRRFFLFGMRFFFGAWLLYVGLSKWIFMGPGTFVGYIAGQFDKTWSPHALNVSLAWLILVAEPVLAILILSGRKARTVWTLTSLLHVPADHRPDHPHEARRHRQLAIPVLVLLCAALSEPDSSDEEDRGEEHRDPRVLPGSQPEVPGIADAQEIQEEAGRDVEEQEGDHEEPRRTGFPVQRKEGGDHQARHVEEFVPSQIMERHLRQRRGLRKIRRPAGLPVEESDVGLRLRGFQADSQREHCDRAGVVVGGRAGKAPDRPCEREDVRDDVQVPQPGRRIGIPRLEPEKEPEPEKSSGESPEGADVLPELQEKERVFHRLPRENRRGRNRDGRRRSRRGPRTPGGPGKARGRCLSCGTRATAIRQPTSRARATMAPNAWTVTGPNRWYPGCGKYGIMGDGEIRRSPPT